MNARLRRVPLLVLVVFVLAVARLARASPGEDRLEDRYLEGEIDAYDFAQGGEKHGESWVSLSGFGGSYRRGTRVGAMAVVGIAFDRVAARPPARAHPTALASFAIDAGDGVSIHPPRRTVVTPLVARKAVAAAWRTSGLGSDDARIADMVSRAHWSSLLPETRLRVMRRFDDADTATLSPTSRYTDTAHLWLEARMTWRLDRLLYAEDEPSIERVREDRIEARARIAARVLLVLGQWQRAWADARASPPESPDAFEASLRMSEAESVLEVLTGGWFTAWRANLHE
jgi:hypothetical protein